MKINASMHTLSAGCDQGKLRRRLLPVLVAGCFGTALANPLGPQVVNGQASFHTQGNVLSVTNTPGTIINWQSFSINPGELTRFIQQNANSAVLNRIAGQDPSQILGALQSNGRVFLVNPNGILFGQGAQIDVNGLVASTLNINNEDFLNGKLLFKAGDKAGNLKNEGTIATPAGGQVILIAPNVENSGIITSPKGDVMLAAGHTVQLVDTLNPDLRVVLSAPEHEALNLGQVIAQGGRTGIYGALVKQRGVINADSAVVGENGKVILKASRDTLLESGSRTSARGAGKGGEIQVLGERVGLFGDARIDASGEQGGGTVLVGGDYQGKNSAIMNAKQTLLTKDARISADAVSNGDGGKVILWGDESTQAYGTISARGGAVSGNGGFVEVSGKYLDMQAKVDTTAANGATGTLLLDPTDVYIANTVANANAAGMVGSASALGGGNSFTGSTISDSLLDVSTLTTSLASSNVTVTTSSGAINVVDPITWGSSTALTLTAANNISVNAQVSGYDLVLQGSQIDLNTTGSLVAARNVDLTATNININGTIKHLSTVSTTGVTTLNATGNIALQGTIQGAGTLSGTTSLTGGYAVKLQGGTITTGAGKTMAINGSGENTVIEFGNNKTWNNNGTVNLTGKSQIRLFDGTNTSTFTNNSTGQFNSSSTSNWTFYSNPGTQSGVINNNGAMTIDGTAAALQSFEAIFNQGATGTLTLANGATLSLQNAQSVQGAINLPAGNKIDVSEYHGTPAAFTNTAFTGSGQLRLTNVAVQANFSNVSAPDTPLIVTNAATKIGAGTSVFASASGLDGVLTLDAGTLAIKGGDFSVPTGASYNGTVGYYATGNLSVPAGAGITTTGGATLIAGWNGNTASPAVATSATGGITLNASHVITNGNNILKAGTGGITTSGTGSGASGMFLQGSPVVLDAIGPISVSALDGDVIARTTGNGTGAISLTDVSALFTGATSVSSVPAGITTANSNITLNAALGVLRVQSGSSVNAGTGTVTLSANSNYDVDFLGAVTGNNIYLSSNGLLTVQNTVTGGSSSGTVDLAAANILLNNGAAITGNNIGLRAKQATTGKIYTASSATASVGASGTTAKIGLKADTIDFSLAAPTLTATQAIQYSTVSDDTDISIGSAFTNATYNAPYLVIGNDTLTDTNTTKDISIISPINQGTKGVVLLAGGLISQTSAGPITAGSLAARAGKITASAGTVSLGEANAVSTFAAEAKGALTLTSNQSLSVGTVTEGTNSLSGIKTNNGNVTVTSNGTNTNISVSPPGIDSCNTTASGTCSTTVTLDATGSITIPLVKAGTKVVLNAGTGVIDGDGSANNIVGANGTIILKYSVDGSIDLDAWGATIETGSNAASSNIRLSAPVVSSGGSTAPPPPTVADCTSNPTLSGCSTVLPTLSTCTTAPTTAGCTAVLPTVDTCVTNPTQSGCTAVLPALSTCTTAPTTAGCSVVLPTLDACTVAPSTAGCSAVLPTVSACTTNPTQVGCSVVLPTLSSCTTNPTQTGCSVVLPTLSSCTTNPTQAGCSVVLPTVSTCATNPTQAGCSVVLPTLSSCTTNPTQAGCSAVLPSMNTCTATPTLAGCTAVLPTLSQCSTTPTLAGCSVVVPTASKCVTNPSAPECQVVLPVAGPGTGTTPAPANTITETVTETTNTMVTTQASITKVQSGSGSSSGGSSQQSEGESKKDDKKTTSSTDDSGVKKNEPAKKLYCN